MQARHTEVRRKTIEMIDSMAVSITDPQIYAHWSNLSSAHQALVKVSITSNGYETVR